MKVIDIEENNRTIRAIVISHRFTDFPDIICSGRKIYQLPCQVGRKSFDIKELKPKYHQGSLVYLIRSKRVNVKRLKEVSVKTDELFTMYESEFCPF
jgi:hypothetical protein